MSRRARGRRFLLVAGLWLAADQLTKSLVVGLFREPGPHRVLIPGYLDLTLTYNPGAAFGLLNNVGWSRGLFILVACGALAALVYWRRSILDLPPAPRYGLALVAAGALGNLLDRLLRGGLVVDFIHFHIARIGFVWPDFNVADIGVTCGMAVYLGHTLLEDYRAARTPASATPPAESVDAA